MKQRAQRVSAAAFCFVLSCLVSSRGSLSSFQRPFSRWTWISRCLLKQRMMEVVVTTGATGRAKLQSNHHHQQTQQPVFYRPDALPVAQPIVSKHWRENITPHGLTYPKLTWGSSNFVFDHALIAPGYLGGGLPCLSSALWLPYPWVLVVANYY